MSRFWRPVCVYKMNKLECEGMGFTIGFTNLFETLGWVKIVSHQNKI